MTTAAICTIGDEILIGQVVDTNTSHIAKALNLSGVKVVRDISISDDATDIYDSLDELLRKCDIVITTGGLGPTKDDITKKVLKDLSASADWVIDEGQLAVVRRVLSVRGIEMSDINMNQASVPSSCEVIINEFGTAPCMVFRFKDDRYPHHPVLYSLPGVPFEAVALTPKVIEDISTHFQLDNITHKSICTYGIAESSLAKMIEPWEDALPADMHLAYLPHALNGVTLRLSIYGDKYDKEDAHKRIDCAFDKIRPILGGAIYGEGEDTLSGIIAKKLTEADKTLSVAESCTGGRIASVLTSLPGASKFFKGSVTSYSNDVKESILKVQHEILLKYGAVSKECASAMASGVRKALGTDYAIATTGIAGPDGGTPEKPVGTVWIAIAYPDPANPSHTLTETHTFRFSSSRSVNIERFSANALNLLRLKLFELQS